MLTSDDLRQNIHQHNQQALSIIKHNSELTKSFFAGQLKMLQAVQGRAATQQKGTCRRTA
jgi:hypothetical protein